MRTPTRLSAVALGGVLVVGTLTGLSVSPAAAASAPSKTGSVSTVSDNGKYRVTWKAPKSNGKKIDRYQVADRVKSGKSWKSWKVKSVKSSKRSLTIKGKNGSLHQARVRAHNSRGWGSWSAKSTIRVGLPDKVTGVAAAGGVKRLTVSWKAGSGNGSALKSYTVQTRAARGAWKSTTVKSSARSLAVTGLVAGKAYEARVRAVNKYGVGSWSGTAKVTLEPTPNPRIAVGTPGPYLGGQQVNVSFSGFPWNVTTLNVAVCANDGRPLTGPQDCATLGGASNKIVSANKGRGSTTITVPTGALGNTNGTAITCNDGTEKCAIVAATIGGAFYFAGPIALEYVDPALTLSNNGPYTGGETLTVNYSGFPGSESQLNVAVCANDGRQLAGPQDCAPFGPGNVIVTPTRGSGSAQITVPTGLLGNTNAPALDCRDDDCMVVVSTFSGQQVAFRALDYAPL